MVKKSLTSPALANVREQIVSFVQKLGGSVLAPRQLRQLVADRRKEWDVPSKITVDRIIDYAVQHELLSLSTFASPSRTERRYASGKVSRFALVQSIRPDSFYRR